MNERMKLYGSPVSNATQRVLFALAEKKVEVDFEVVDLMNQQQKSPEFLALNPFGKVPVLKDGDIAIYESMAIVRYLDKTIVQNPLMPMDSKQFAFMEQWISVHYSYLATAVGKMMYHKIFPTMRGKPVDTPIVESAREEIARILDIVENTLESSEFLSGDCFSLAEIAYVPDLQILFISGDQDLILERKNISRWWNAVSNRPTWQKVLKEAEIFMQSMKMNS